MTAISPNPQPKTGAAVTAAKTLLRSWLPPIVAAVVIFGGWEALLAVIHPDGFVLPPPSDIASAVAENFDAIVTATGVTGFIIVTGLLGGVVVGAGFALLVTASGRQRDAHPPGGGRQCGADHRAGADLQRLVRDPVAPLEPGRGGGAGVLPDLHQHGARA